LTVHALPSLLATQLAANYLDYLKPQTWSESIPNSRPGQGAFGRFTISIDRQNGSFSIAPAHHAPAGCIMYGGKVLAGKNGNHTDVASRYSIFDGYALRH